jgi:hypothetical protein
MTVLNERERSLERSVWSQDGIGLDPVTDSYRKDAKLGSVVLREACLDLFCRTANRYQISLDDAMACHLGFHAPARLIKAPFKTASAQRLAA